MTDDELAPSDIDGPTTRPDTPPAKEEAFEDFKKRRGSELNRVLLDNKGLVITALSLSS